jgi:hypothetical protein
MWVLPLSIAHSSAWLDRIGANLTRLRGEIEQSVRDQVILNIEFVCYPVGCQF